MVHIDVLFSVHQVHVVELGPHQPGNFALSSHQEMISFTDSEENQTYDFPTALQVNHTSKT